MSGGSLNYAEYKLDEIARNIDELARTPLHRALAEHLRKCGKAVHALEWMLSCDTAEGSEIEAIKAVLSKNAALKQVTKEAKDIMEQLREEIGKAESAI